MRDVPRSPAHRERHLSHRAAWLRAVVLGANDGIVSTASLLLGVAAAEVSSGALLATGVAALVAGALSMAVGEYVSVSSQRDAEQADIARERSELERFPQMELEELTGIYVAKGLSAPLAREVAVELSQGDQLAVHLAEELGITDATRARPLQAMASSAGSFAAGAVVPLLAMAVSPPSARIPVTAVAALLALGGLGAVGARAGGARLGRPTVRVLVGGAVAMAATMVIGRLVGTSVG
jgi:VIT1/CCC1 family predicted Fe2+/Mn2+ transporter